MHDDGVKISERTQMSVASILARRGIGTERIAETLNMDLPVGSRWTTKDSLTMIGTGPGIWLASRQAASSGWCDDLARKLVDVASVSDQTGAYRIFHLEGRHARTVLQRGAPVELDCSAFPSGSVAVTAIAYVDTIIRCLADNEHYEVAIYRSYTDSFMRWLNAALAAL